MCHKSSQAIVPVSLIRHSGKGIGWTRVRSDEEPYRANCAGLNSERRGTGGIAEDGTRERAVTCETVKASDARLVHRELFQQERCGSRKLARFELRGIAGRSFDDVGEAETVIQ